MKLSPCLERSFSELPFVDRIAAVADAGCEAAEFWGHGNKGSACGGGGCRSARRGQHEHRPLKASRESLIETRDRIAAG